MKLDEALTLREPLNEWRLPLLTNSISKDLSKFTARELAQKLKNMIGQDAIPPTQLVPADDQAVEKFKQALAHPKMQEVLTKYPDIKETLEKIADSAGLEQLPLAPEEPAPVMSNIDPQMRKQMLDIKKEIGAYKAKPKGSVQKLVGAYLQDPKKKRAYQLAIKTGLIEPPKD